MHSPIVSISPTFPASFFVLSYTLLPYTPVRISAAFVCIAVTIVCINVVRLSFMTTHSNNAIMHSPTVTRIPSIPGSLLKACFLIPLTIFSQFPCFSLSFYFVPFVFNILYFCFFIGRLFRISLPHGTYIPHRHTKSLPKSRPASPTGKM